MMVRSHMIKGYHVKHCIAAQDMSVYNVCVGGDLCSGVFFSQMLVPISLQGSWRILFWGGGVSAVWGGVKMQVQ